MSRLHSPVRAFLFFLLLTSLPFSMRAVGERPLAAGLSYLRIKNLNEETPVSDNPALVVDLRGTSGSGEAVASRLGPILRPIGQHAIRLVLIDETTSPDILELLGTRSDGLLTLAAKSAVLKPDVAVAVAPDLDRKAREALDAGKPIPELLEQKREKRRYDEASMNRDHANGVEVPSSPPSLTDAPSPENEGPGAAGSDPAAKEPPKPAPLMDLVLQRAVHVYQGLKALKKV